jgi:hypothetical protein
VVHLAKRFAGSLSGREPDADGIAWAAEVLSAGERVLWSTMSVADRRHSLLVARRFVAELPDAPRDAVAAALLHDVGKVECGLGTWGRVAATMVGPHGRRFRQYHAHEQIGAAMAAAAGAAPATVEAIAGRGEYADRLRAADDI